MTKEQIQSKLKDGQVAVDITYVEEEEKDEFGFPFYRVEYVNPPKNFKFLRLLEAHKLAILEDLDYEKAN